jgi:hypothetical protein
MLGRPREEARVLVERHGPAAAPADEPGLVRLVLGERVVVLRQCERMFARLSRDGTRANGRPFGSVRFNPCQTNS